MIANVPVGRYRRCRHVRLPGLVLALLLATTATVWAQAGATPEEGQQLFNDLCSGCHTIGQGDLVGPDLEGVSDRRDGGWLVRWIIAPDELIAAGDPVALDLLAQYNNVPMPNLGLSEAQAQAIISYLGGEVTAAPVQPPTLPPGDAAEGKSLFTGSTSFSGGGPPCLACHSAGGVGSLGGGALGPDLTNSYQKWGEAGLAAFVTNPSTPTMRMVWAGRPLTPEETADIVAFLEQAPVSERPAGAVVRLLMFATVGLVILLGLAHLLWRDRLRAVRRPVLAGSQRSTAARTR